MSFASQMTMLQMHRAVKNGSTLTARRYRMEDVSPEDAPKKKKPVDDVEEDPTETKEEEIARARARYAKYQAEWQNAMKKAKADGGRTPGQCERLVEARNPQLRGKLMLASEALQNALRR